MFNVRAMTEWDVPAVSSIEQRCHSQPWSKDIFYNALKQYCSVVLEAEQPQVAYLIWDYVLNEAQILNLTVDIDFQGKGYAKQLIKNFIQDCLKNGIVKIFLEVRKDNIPALSLYKAIGFKQVGLQKNYYRVGDKQVDALVMELQLGKFKA